jgi:hypothetical protein
MLVFEFKAYGKQNQFNAVDEAIRTANSSAIAVCAIGWITKKWVDTT